MAIGTKKSKKEDHKSNEADSSLIPLKILIIDNDQKLSSLLREILLKVEIVKEADLSSTLEKSIKMLDNYYNVIYIDPLSFGIESSSNFVESVRITFPESVYVIFSDLQIIQDYYPEEMFGGYLLRHYFKFDKNLPFKNLVDKIEKNIQGIQGDFDQFVIQKNKIKLIERLQDLTTKYEKENLKQLTIKKVQKLISQDEVLESLDILHEYFANQDGSEGTNFVISQTAAYKRLKKQKLKNLITNEQFSVGISRIVEGVLEFAIGLIKEE